MKPLVVVTIVLVLLAVPSGLALAGTARTYLATSRDIVTLRFSVVDLQPPADPGTGYRRAQPGPNVTLRLVGVEQTMLTLAEVSFDLEVRGVRLARASQRMDVAIPRGAATTVAIETNLEPERAEQARAIFAGGDPDLILNGRALLRLPNSGEGIWLDLRGPVRATVAGMPAGCAL